MLMKDKFLSKAVPRGTRTIWRYLSALILLFTLAIGNMWGTATKFHTFAAAGDTILDLQTISSTTGLSDKLAAINGTDWASVSTSSKNATVKRIDPSTGETATSTSNLYGTKLASSHKTILKVQGVTSVSFYIGGGSSRKGYLNVEADEGDKRAQVESAALSNTCAVMTCSLDKDSSYTVTASASGDIFCYAVKITVAPSAAVAPAITAPTTDQSATYTVGDAITALEVTATGSPAPSYQWYSNASASTTGATLITGAESASYTPSSAAESDLYFYCVATNSEGSAQSPYFHVEVNAAVATAPSFTSPASEPAVAEYSVGDAISALEVVAAGYPAPTLQWYSNSSKSTEGATLITGAESASYTPSNAAVSDLYFYCVATNASGTAQSEYFHVTVAAVSYCAELNPATSGDEPVLGTVIAMQTGSYGGSIKVVGRKQSGSFAYTANGLTFNKGGVDSVRVTLNHLIKKDTKIYVTVNNQDGSKDQGFYLQNLSKTKKADMHRQNGSTGDTTYVYTADNGDGLVGVNEFIIARGASSAALKSLKVSNCGAELHALTSAVDPVGEATVTLSKNLVETSGIATANFTIANPLAYDFDEWVISSGDATIADAHADEAVITMGSTDAVITLKLKAASTKHTVTYYDENDNNLGEELVVEGQHPVGLSIAPRKLGYTFAGWGLSKAGPVVAFNEVTVNADMPLYTIWNEIDCSAQSGTIYSMSITVAPAANCTIKTAEGYSATWDLYQYEGVSGGEAIIGNTGDGNSCILQTNKTILLKDNVSYLKLDFDCPLKEGDKIRTNVTGSGKAAYISTDATRPEESAALAIILNSTTGEIVVPAALDNAQTIYIWKGGGNVTITSINIYRPAHFAVTFNMHDHGDAVDPQSVVEGGKVTKPTDPTASGWDFGGWFTDDTYGTIWDFENMTISAATEIHALWTVHSTSTDASLSDLQVNGVTVPEFAPTKLVYNVELPMGTTVVPTVVATPTDANAVATVDPCTLAGATITVVPESGVGDKQVYTINFSIATSKDIQLVFKTGTTPCVGSASTSTQILSNNAAVSTYINQIAFTNVEGAGDNGAEGSSLNVGKKAGNMFTLSAKPGYAFQAMNFLAKIQDATCEYSIDGGDWTELASTNQSGDECYAPFTSGTVHEFRLRSTGAEGVWIRNMQLTIIEACTPVAIAWNEEPVEFEVGKAGYVIAATANNAGEVAYSSTDGDVIAVNASTGALTISALGSVTLKAATAEGDGTTYCENGGNDIEISKAVNTYYLVKFDGQNGEAADEVKYYSGDAAIALPAAPTYAGYDFQGWFDAAEGGNQITEAFNPNSSMTVYAQWVAQCAGAAITTQPTGASYLTGRTPVALVCEATAGNGGELTYEWFTCDDEYKANPVAATATPSTAVAGTFYYFCKVTEAGCAVEAFSDVVTITVADKDPICLVKAELAPGESAASITSTSGYYKDDANIAINIKKDLKLGSTGNYVKVAIDGANFQDGDVVEITLASDKTASAWLQIFTDEGTTMVAEMTSGVSREHPNYLTISGVPANTKTLYLYRTEAADGNMNPYPTSMAVYRTSAPILNKVTVAGVEGAPDNTNHVAIEVPASTADAALDAIAYDWVSNDAAWTAAHNPAVANAWEWGVENTVTLTDKDNDQSVYYVTISKAAASSDATLSALTVNGQAIALADGVFDYTFELPYGTSVVPTVEATPNHVAAVATVDPCTLSGATITIVPESGAGDQQIYTLTFVISKWKEIVIWDGSTMSAVATSPEATTGFAWETVGFGSIGSYTTTYGEKSYSKYLPSGGSSTGRYMTLTVPEGYVAKFYVVMATHSDTKERGMFIGSNLVKDPDATSVLELSNNDRDIAVAGMSEVAGAGTWYINPNNSIDFQEIRVYLRKGMVRNSMLGNGVLGTSCVDHNVAVEDIQGATFYELKGRENTYGKLAFDEIVSGELEAGAPYVFQAHGDKLILFFGETSVADPVDKGNGMYGTFSAITLTELDDVYYFAQRALWSCVDLTSLSVPANRAYVKLSEIDYLTDPNPAPGRRRILLSVNGETQAQGFENLESGDAPVKVMIDGTLYIIRGEKVFDATGRLVK